MSYDLLIGAGPNVTGQWIHVEPTRALDIPLGFSYAYTGGNGGNILIEQLVMGVPGFGASSPYPPQADTGTAVLMRTIPLDGNVYDLTISTPVEYVRGRTDSGVVGSVNLEMTENS